MIIGQHIERRGKMKYEIDYFTKKFKEMPKEIDVLCLGTTNCHFAYDFQGTGIRGFNMGIFKNAFYNPYLLEKYGKRLSKNAVVLITLEYPG